MLDGRIDPDLTRLLAPRADPTRTRPTWWTRILKAWRTK